MNKPLSTLKFIVFLIKTQKSKICLLILLSVIWGVFPVLDNLILKYMIDNILNINIDSILAITLLWSIIYFFWFEFSNLLGRLYDVVYLKTFPLIKRNAINYLVSYSMRHSESFFEDNKSGDICYKINIIPESLEELYVIGVEEIFTKGVFIFTAIITLLMLNLFLGLILFAWIMLFSLIIFISSSKSNRLSQNVIVGYQNISEVIIDLLANISSVMKFHNYGHERKRLQKYLDNSSSLDANTQIYMTKVRYCLTLTTSIMVFAVIFTSLKLYHAQEITIGDITLIVNLIISIINDIRDVIEEIAELFEKISAINNSCSLLSNYDIQDKKNACKLNIVKGEIEYKNVSFQYNKSYNLFNNKSVKINSKEKIGLVGFSGSGKTSFTNLLVRLYEIDQGEILIDGQNIKNVTLESLRSNISIIPQNTCLFNRSIKENIAYGRDKVEDLEIIEAAKKVYMHDFIDSLPKKYDSLCGENGKLLSGGQRQRVIIARAIIKNAPILILDEATSSLDLVAETHIQESLKYVMKGKTVIVIAHRLSTLENMDRILVFDKGKIVEDGNHNNLINKNGLYKKLWLSQLKV